MGNIKNIVLPSFFLLSFTFVFIAITHDVVAQKEFSPEVTLPEENDVFVPKNIKVQKTDMLFEKKEVSKKTMRSNISPEVTLPEENDVFIIRN